MISWIWAWMNLKRSNSKMRIALEKLNRNTFKEKMRSKRLRKYAKNELNKESTKKRRLIVCLIQHMAEVLIQTLTLTPTWSTLTSVMMVHQPKKRRKLKVKLSHPQKNLSKSDPRLYLLQDKNMRLNLRGTSSISILIRNFSKNRKNLKILVLSLNPLKIKTILIKSRFLMLWQRRQVPSIRKQWRVREKVLKNTGKS